MSGSMLDALRKWIARPNRSARESGPAPRSKILEGPLTKTLLSVTWPLLVTGQLAQVISIMMFFWVARLEGTAGLAAWVVIFPAASILWRLVPTTLAQGSESLIAQSVGAKDGGGLAILGAALRIAPYLLVPLVIAGLVLLGPVSNAVLAGDETPRLMRDFLGVWLLLVLPLGTILELFMATITVTGWTRFGIVRVLLDLVLLFVLMPLFMATLGLGMAGPALAQTVATIILLVVVGRAIRRNAESLGLGTPTRSWFARAATHSSGDRALWRRIVEIGLPPQLGQIAIFASQLFYRGMLDHLDQATVGGYGLAFEVLFIIGTIGMATSFGTAIMIGQNMGAGQWRRSVGALVRGGAILAGMMAAFLILTPFARPVLGLLSDDPEVLDSAMQFLGILKWGWIGTVVYQILNGAYRAVGATKLASTFVILSEVVGVGFALLYPGDALHAVAYGFCVSCTFRAVFLLAIIRRSLITPLVKAAAKAKQAA
jgi:Na+-driven multidrug efflux pump